MKKALQKNFQFDFTAFIFLIVGVVIGVLATNKITASNTETNDKFSVADGDIYTWVRESDLEPQKGYSDYVISNFKVSKGWVTFSLSSELVNVPSDAHMGEYNIISGIAKQDKNGNWNYALDTENLQLYKELSLEAPDYLIPPESKKIIQSWNY